MSNTFLQRVSITVSDIQFSEKFYINVFMFSRIYHKIIPLNKIEGYPNKVENKNGNLELVMLSQGQEKPMLGLMKLTPINEKKSGALIFYTNEINNISNNFEKYGGKVTMNIRDGESFDMKENIKKPSLAMMGIDPDNHFIEVIQFKE